MSIFDSVFVRMHRHLLMYCVCFTWLLACETNVDIELGLAGENKRELKKVISFFQDDPCRLKIESALFLIKNMPYNYTYKGKAVEQNEMLFLKTAEKSLDNRGEYFNRHAFLIDYSSMISTLDLHSVKADYLIKVIDETCDEWIARGYDKEYSKEVFFNYVLPYRIDVEPLSDWKASIRKEYPYLTSDIILSRRGLQYEAEDARLGHCDVLDVIGASNNKAIMLTNDSSSVVFCVKSMRNTNKRLILKYSAVDSLQHILLSVNDRLIDTLSLSPMRNFDTFSEKWFNCIIPIKKGENEIELSLISGSVEIDYIQLGAVETYSKSDFEDFSQYCYSICNRETDHSITFDTLSFEKTQVVELTDFSDQNRAQFLNVDYVGYSLWRIGSYNNAEKNKCLEIAFGTPKTLSSYKEVSIADHIIRPFQHWAFFPVGNGYYRIMNKHTGLFLEAYKDKQTGKEYLVQNKYSTNRFQQWRMIKRMKRPFFDNTYQVGSAISNAVRVYDITHQFSYYMYGGPLQPSLSSLIKAKSGKCVDETHFSVMLCRSLLIPSAVDFTPNWANRSNNHSWCTLIRPDGSGMPFYLNTMPGDTASYFHPYLKPKVFRRTYQLNQKMADDLSHEREVPSLFETPKFIDVTREYYITSNVIREVPKKYSNRKVAYICVFDNHKWVPVYYGNIRNGKVSFNSMVRHVVYISAMYSNGVMIPFGNPFILMDDGSVKELSASNKRCTMNLLRKYPFMGAQDYFNRRMNGGEFQASNREDFSDGVLLHKHQGITNGNWYDINVRSQKKFQYLRYIGGKGSYCNINELEFYEANGSKIMGEIIGSEGEENSLKENVFDGDILTGFSAKSPDGNWVGIKLNTPKQVSKIRYIGRNDGNGIEIGDHYALYYWTKNGWTKFEEKIATVNSLIFYNVPSDGLYILRDKSKGKEERIFTYNKGRQVWW